MQKRAQISLFLILGFTILFLTVLALSLNKIFIKKEETTLFAIDTEEINEYIKKCIEETTEEAIDNIYLYSGYSGLSKAGKIKYETACLVYKENGLYKNKVPVISSYEEFLEKEIKDYLIDNLGNCLNLQERFEEYNINTYNLEIEVDIPNADIQQEDIRINIKYPVEIEKGKIREQLSTFNIKFRSSLRTIYKYVNLIVGDEAGSLNNGYLSNNWCNTIQEGINLKCSEDRKYTLVDPLNNKNFYFGVCK